MSQALLHLASVSAKIAFLGGLAWLQLHLLRRAPAASRSRLCSMALLAIGLFAAGEMVVAPQWLVGPVIRLTAAASFEAPPSSIWIPASSWIEYLWLAGVLVMLARAIAGRTALAMLRHRATLLDRVSGLDIRLGEVETPILTGVMRPAIMLPASARNWTDEQRRMVMTHELTHFRRGDCWSNLLAQALRAAFWFHPIVWLLVSRMSREQELTCDEAVVAAGHSPHDYAAFLLETVRNLQSREMFACAMAGSGAHSLKRRFANLLDTRRRPGLSGWMAASMALFAAVVLMLAAVQPVWSRSEMGRVYRTGTGASQPAVLYKVDPQYSEEARREKISGTVLVQLVVMPDGRADRIKVVKGTGFGLDRKAIEAIQKWKFKPGMKNGIAVPVYATVEVNFWLK